MPRILGKSSTRAAASFATGAVLAFVGSRLLPPIVAQARGAVRASAGGDPLSALIDDHRAIMSHLDAMAETADNQVFERTQRLLRVKRRLAAHAMAEEDIVYPVLRGTNDASRDAMHLYEEHARMKILLYRLERDPKDSGQWHTLAMELRTLIRDHVRQEEEVEFPRLRAALDDAAARELAGKIQREEALVL